MHKKEKELERAFDKEVKDWAKMFNYQEEIPWLELTRRILMVYFVITIFSDFYRPDFMSTTAVSIGFYIVTNTDRSKRSDFRLLVMFLLVTFVYDLIFLVFVHDEKADEEEN